MVKKNDPQNAAGEQCGMAREGYARATPTRAGGHVGSASPSNTAHANYIAQPEGTKILRYAVDSLYVSYSGRVLTDYEDQLQALKEKAQQKNDEETSQAFIQLVDHQFEVLGKGKGYFPFVLVDNWYHISLSRSGATQFPMGYVQIASELLTRTGVEAAIRSLSNIMAILKGEPVSPVVSRVDLCADFTTDCDLSQLEDVGWITRARQYSRYRDGKQFSGFSFGLGGEMSGRLYNKTLELKKSKKDYLIPLWQQAGWDGQSDVWRLEFQYKRAALTGIRVNRIADLLLWMNSIWYYAVTEWLQIKQPIEDTNCTRWPVHPFWTAFYQPEFNSHPIEPISRVRKTRMPYDDYLFIHGLAPITSYMAKHGIDDFNDAVQAFVKDAGSYHRRRSQTTGKALRAYVGDKVKEKRKRYNVKEEADVAADAKRYRQAKGKEV